MMYVLVGLFVFLFLMCMGQGLRILKLEEAVKLQLEHNKSVSEYFKKLNEYLDVLEKRIENVESSTITKQ